MAKTQVITEAMIEAALEKLEKRIAEPPPPAVRSYTRKDAFLKLRERAKAALAAGHSLETVVDDLKGVGIGLSLSTARQYLKPGRKPKSKPAVVVATVPPVGRPSVPQTATAMDKASVKVKGTFAVREDETEI